MEFPDPLKAAGVEVDDRKVYRFALAGGDTFEVRETRSRSEVELAIIPADVSTNPQRLPRVATLNAKQWAAVTHLGYILEVVESRKPETGPDRVAIPTAVARPVPTLDAETPDGMPPVLTPGRAL